MSNYPKIDGVIQGILQNEGSAFTNDPKDSGGPTKYGITLKTLQVYRGRATTASDVEHLQESEAREIYLKMYFLDPRLDLIAAASDKIAAEVMDTGVNAGAGKGVELLQRALNAFNKQGTVYPDLVVDGKCGQTTANALAAFLKARGPEGESVLLCLLNCLQAFFYVELSERRQKDEEFIYGWIKNRVYLQIKG